MVRTPSPVDHISDELFTKHRVKVWVKREDLIHPEIMGNKWRKLKYNLLESIKQGKKGILTFGGAYSNHIAATAAACRDNQLKSIGIIRGDELSPNSNHTLRTAHQNGMELRFVDRTLFRQLKESPNLIGASDEYYLVPEGGTNALAIKGCTEIIDELTDNYNYIFTAFGTGGTMAGLLKGLGGTSELVGISSLKGNWMDQEFSELCSNNNISYTNYQIINDFHFGGYGKVTDELIQFINRTKQKNGLQLDPIYTGKLYFGVCKLIADDFFPENSKILVIHTGGLQGVAGFNEKAGKKILL
mgnify:CR=1 FL=1